MLKLDRRPSTNKLHHKLSLLKSSEKHIVGELSFVNCNAARCQEAFCNHYQVRQKECELRNDVHLGVTWARTEMDLSSYSIKRPRLSTE